eukprot:COSAG05_NODE_241_length_13068_cov_438.050968_1_plen_599_part_10
MTERTKHRKKQKQRQREKEARHARKARNKERRAGDKKRKRGVMVVEEEEEEAKEEGKGSIEAAAVVVQQPGSHPGAAWGVTAAEYASEASSLFELFEDSEDSDGDDELGASDGGDDLADRMVRREARESHGENGNSDDDDDDDDDDDEIEDRAKTPLYVLPMYSMLPATAQQRVFQPPPPGHRLVVVATNVAETSITIPGIRYVVDCGRSKQKQYDRDSDAVFSYQVAWISKASATQRAGRAGRIGPGHCYRLFSSAVYDNHFPTFSQPEMARMPLDSVCLRLKCLGVTDVHTFPFPTIPPPEALSRAVGLLRVLGCLDSDGKPTVAGREVAQVPASPRLGLMLILAKRWGCLQHGAMLVAAMSVGDPCTHSRPAQKKQGGTDDKASGDDEGTIEDDAAETNAHEASLSLPVQAAFGDPYSDLLRVLNTVGAFQYEVAMNGGGDIQNAVAVAFCARYNLSHKLMGEIVKLTAQLTRDNGLQFNDIAMAAPPDAEVSVLLRKLVVAAYIDHVARLKPLPPGTPYHPNRGAAYIPMRRADGVQGEETPEGTTGTRQAWLHRGSALHSCRTDSPPEWLVYQDVTEGRYRGGGMAPKRFLRHL